MAHRRLAVGGVALWLLDCGGFRYDGGVIFGAVPKAAWQRAYPADDANLVPFALRPLLVEGEDGLILVNAGLPEDGGGMAQATPVPVVRALAEVGVGADDITAVVLTHLHSDHIGGSLTGETGGLEPAFLRARYLVQAAEVAAATFTNERTRADYVGEQVTALQRAGVLQPVRGTHRLSRAVRLAPAPGHTPGHQCLEVRDDGESAVYVSDLAVVPIQAERLAWISALDTHPMRSLESKREVLGRAVERRSLVLFEHEPDDARAVGRLVPAGKRWAFVAEGE